VAPTASAAAGSSIGTPRVVVIADLMFFCWLGGPPSRLRRFGAQAGIRNHSWRAQHVAMLPEGGRDSNPDNLLQRYRPRFQRLHPVSSILSVFNNLGNLLSLTAIPQSLQFGGFETVLRQRIHGILPAGRQTAARKASVSGFGENDGFFTSSARGASAHRTSSERA
jgi:hypothetical protein